METIERLAREYREALSSSNDDPAVYLDQIVLIEENQLDFIDAILARNQLSPTLSRTLNYVKNIVFRILNKLNALLKNPSYVPSFRSPQTPCRALKSTLLNSQISLFALYDKLPLPFSDLAELLSLENRKTALLGVL